MIVECIAVDGVWIFNYVRPLRYVDGLNETVTVDVLRRLFGKFGVLTRCTVVGRFGRRRSLPGLSLDDTKSELAKSSDRITYRHLALGNKHVAFIG